MAASLFFSAPKLESVSTADTSDSFLLVNLSPFAAVISKVSPRTTISFTFPEFILATASEREMSWLFDTGLKATTKAAAIIKTKKTIPIYFPSCLTIVETYLNTKNSLLQGYFKNVKILLHRAFYIFNLGLGFQVFHVRLQGRTKANLLNFPGCFPNWTKSDLLFLHPKATRRAILQSDPLFFLGSVSVP